MSESPTETSAPSAPSAPSSRGRSSVIGGVAAFGRTALRIALDAALPPLCPACRTPLGDGGGLCPACWAKVSFIAPPYCYRLAACRTQL
jgi:hypothetical protein